MKPPQDEPRDLGEGGPDLGGPTDSTPGECDREFQSKDERPRIPSIPAGNTCIVQDCKPLRVYLSRFCPEHFRIYQNMCHDEL